MDIASIYDKLNALKAEYHEAVQAKDYATQERLPALIKAEQNRINAALQEGCEPDVDGQPPVVCVHPAIASRIPVSIVEIGSKVIQGEIGVARVRAITHADAVKAWNELAKSLSTIGS